MQQRSIRYTRWLVSALGGALLLSSAACDDKITNSLVLAASSITVSAASNGQAGVAGQPLAQPIVVHVSDQNGASTRQCRGRLDGCVRRRIGQRGDQPDGRGRQRSVTWTLGNAAGMDSLQAAISSGASVTSRRPRRRTLRPPSIRSAATISPSSQARPRRRWWCRSLISSATRSRTRRSPGPPPAMARWAPRRRRRMRTAIRRRRSRRRPRRRRTR